MSKKIKKKLTIPEEEFNNNWDAIFNKSHALKENNLDEKYEHSQQDIADKLFLSVGTVASDEKKGIEKFKQAFADRNINVKDLLED